MRSGGRMARVAVAVVALVAVVTTGAASPAAAAGAPAASFSPNPVDFGNQVVGTSSSPDQALTVTNTGSADLHVSSASTSAPFSVSVDGCSGTTVPAGGDCVIFLSFTPTMLGPVSGSLTVVDDASDSPQTVGLTGNGVGASAVTFDPASIDFGNVPVGQHVSHTVTLTNTGGSVLIIKGVGHTGDYFISASTCSSVGLGVEQSCHFDVTFSPIQAGVGTGTAFAEDNAPDSPQSMPLTGTGTAPAVSLDPTSIDFGDRMVGSTTTTVEVVTNTGNDNLDVTSVDAGAGTPFSVVTETCTGSAVPPAGTCSIFVRFTPTATGLATGSLTITDDALDSPQTVALSGNGTPAAPLVSLNPTSVDFGDVALNSTTPETLVTLTNTGTADLSVSGGTVGPVTEGFFFGATDTCSHQTIAPGASCQIGVVFRPAQAGLAAGSLTLDDNASDSPQSVPLSGTGVGPLVTPSPTSVDFGNVPINATSPETLVTFTNSGLTDLSVSGGTVGPVTEGFFFGETDTCSHKAIAPGASCQIGVVFRPASTGSVTGSLTLDDNAPDSPQTVPLSGTGFVPEPAASVSPTSLDFGGQNVGGTKTTVVQVTSTGTGDLHVSAVQATGAFSVVSETCTGTAVAPGHMCNIFVRFTPTATGPATGTLTITDDAADSPQSVPLSGTGTAPVVSVAPDPINFPDQAVGGSVTTGAVVTNTGTGDLHVTGVHATGAFSMVSETCTGTPVAPNGTCNIFVRFTPTATGLATGTLAITDDAADSPQSVPLSGTGTAPTVTVHPTSVDFGNVVVGQSSSPATVTVTNSGTAPLDVSQVAITGAGFGLSFAGNTCGPGIAPGDSCTIQLLFTPTATGLATGTLAITDDAADSPQSVPLSGTGTAPAVTVHPTSVDFGNVVVGQSSSPATVTVTNSGTAPLDVSQVAITGAGFGLSFAGNTCGPGIAPGDSCTIQLLFTPTATGLATGTLAITDDAADSPQSVPLSGTGTAPAVTVHPTSVDFGNVVVGQSSSPATVTVTNSGTAPLDVSQVAITGAGFGLSFAGNTCGPGIAPGDSCTIQLLFTPTATGLATGTLAITDDAADSPQSVPLSGTGTAPAVTVHPTSVDFGNVVVGQSSSPATVTVTNSGTAPLDVSQVAITGAGFGLSFAGNTCGPGIAPGDSCTIQLLFTPTATGLATGTLAITDDAADSPQSVPLSGTGTAPAVTVHPTSVDFGNVVVGQSSSPATVTVTNSGTAPLDVSQVAITGAGFGLSFAGNTCGPGIAPGDSCTIQLLFTPTATGLATGTLAITDDAADSPQSVPLSGTGTAPTVTVHPTSVDFGNVVVGQSSSPATVTVTNSGTAPLDVSQVAITGAGFGLSFAGNTCGPGIAPGDSCTIQLLFTPTATGLATGTLAITDDAADSPQSVPLSGTGLKPAPVVTGISPDHGAAGGGTTVTIQGDNFIPGATQVTIGGVVVPPSGVVIAGDPTATFTTPAHAPGPVQVVISTPDGNSNALTFTYDSVPPPTPPPAPPAVGTASGSTGPSLTSTPGGANRGIGGATTGSGETTLAFTGSDLGAVVEGGLALVVFGALLLLIRRRLT